MKSRVSVKKSPGRGRGVFAKEPLVRGQLVVRGRPLKIVEFRTDYSFQVDKDKHVQLNVPARIINHSCDPNLGIRNNKLGGYDFIALRKIQAGEELTWDYCMTEFISIAINQQCLCGDVLCRKDIRGFICLPEEIREKYGEFIGDYLKQY